MSGIQTFHKRPRSLIRLVPEAEGSPAVDPTSGGRVFSICDSNSVAKAQLSPPLSRKASNERAERLSKNRTEVR